MSASPLNHLRRLERQFRAPIQQSFAAPTQAPEAMLAALAAIEAALRRREPGPCEARNGPHDGRRSPLA